MVIEWDLFTADQSWYVTDNDIQQSAFALHSCLYQECYLADWSLPEKCLEMYACLCTAYVQLSEKCLDAFDEGPPVVVDMPNGQ